MSKLSYYTDPSECYFVAYHCIAHRNIVDGINDISNIMLRGIHPLIWIEKESENYRKHFITYISFWDEIPESLFEYMQKYQNTMPCEDFKIEIS